VISIPNNTIVNATVENLSLRPMRRQNLLLQIAYDTAGDKMEAFCRGIERIFEDTEMVNKETYYVRFNDFGESSLNVLAAFDLVVPNRATELSEREALLLKIMDLAQELGVDFAAAPRTAPVEPAAPAVRAVSGS
jgi:MscS family membrane protein